MVACATGGFASPRNIKNQNQKMSCKDLRSLARNKTFKGTMLVLTASSLASVQTL